MSDVSSATLADALTDFKARLLTDIQSDILEDFGGQMKAAAVAEAQQQLVTAVQVSAMIQGLEWQ